MFNIFSRKPEPKEWFVTFSGGHNSSRQYFRCWALSKTEAYNVAFKMFWDANKVEIENNLCSSKPYFWIEPVEKKK